MPTSTARRVWSSLAVDFDNHDQNRGASLKLGRSGTKVEHNAHYLVLSFDGTLIPSTGGDRWWMWQSSRVHRKAVRR